MQTCCLTRHRHARQDGMCYRNEFAAQRNPRDLTLPTGLAVLFSKDTNDFLFATSHNVTKTWDSKIIFVNQ